MPDYSGLSLAALREMCKQLGIPQYPGPKEAVLARLAAHEQAQRDASVATAGGEPPAASAVVAEPDTAGEPAAPKVFRTEYPCPAELGDAEHMAYVLETRDRAIAAGLSPKGGVAAASRVGWGSQGGVRTAVYEISLRRAG